LFHALGGVPASDSAGGEGREAGWGRAQCAGAEKAHCGGCQCPILRPLSEAEPTLRDLRTAPISVENDPHRTRAHRNSPTGEFMDTQCSVDLKRERFDDRRPESNIGCEGLSEFFGVGVESRFDARVD